MANPYFIQSADYGSGLSALGQQIGQLGQQRKREQAFEQQQQQAQERQQAQELAQQATMQKARDLFASNASPQEIALFSIDNPEVGKSIMASMQFRDEASKENLMDTMQAIVSGGNVEQALTSRANYLKQQGIDNQDTLDEIEQYQADPEGFVEQKKELYTLLDSDYADRVLKGEPEATKFQQGAGDMSGYSFNPDTGKYSIDPSVKDRLNKAKSLPSLDAKTRQSINKDITQLSKDTKLIKNTAMDLEKLSTIKSGPASIAMVFKFMKALDPTSVVREGEFITAENSAGVPEALMNTYNKLIQGGRLGPEQIKQFVTTAKQLANSAIASSNTEVNSFLDTFEDTLPTTFKSSVLKRIPQPFDMGASTVNTTETNEESEVSTPAVDLSDEELLKKYGG